MPLSKIVFRVDLKECSLFKLDVEGCQIKMYKLTYTKKFLFQLLTWKVLLKNPFVYLFTFYCVNFCSGTDTKSTNIKELGFYHKEIVSVFRNGVSR